MKYIPLLFVSFLFTSCQPKSLPTIINFDENKIVVKLSHESTKKEIQEIIELLSGYNAILNTESSEFFEDGKLRDLNLRLTLPNGKGGALSAKLTNIQFNYYGFILSIDDNGNVSPIKFGAI